MFGAELCTHVITLAGLGPTSAQLWFSISGSEMLNYLISILLRPS